MSKGLNVKWEMFQDKTYFDFWAVRPKGDRDANSPRLFHFANEEDAEQFKRLVELSYHAVPNNK